jgi:hypothetical protein
MFLDSRLPPAQSYPLGWVSNALRVALSDVSLDGHPKPGQGHVKCRMKLPGHGPGANQPCRLRFQGKGPTTSMCTANTFLQDHPVRDANSSSNAAAFCWYLGLGVGGQDNNFFFKSSTAPVIQVIVDRVRVLATEVLGMCHSHCKGACVATALMCKKHVTKKAFHKELDNVRTKGHDQLATVLATFFESVICTERSAVPNSCIGRKLHGVDITCTLIHSAEVYALTPQTISDPVGRYV